MIKNNYSFIIDDPLNTLAGQYHWEKELKDVSEESKKLKMFWCINQQKLE
jgi:hypothetical protein